MKRNNKRTKLNQKVYDIKQIEKYLHQINGIKHRTVVSNANSMIF